MIRKTGSCFPQRTSAEEGNKREKDGGIVTHLTKPKLIAKCTFSDHTNWEIFLQEYFSHLDMRCIDVTRVIFFGWDQLYSGIIIRKDVLEAVSLSVFRQPSYGALTIYQPFLLNALVLSEHHPLLQPLLQNLTLQDRTRTTIQSHILR